MSVNGQDLIPVSSLSPLDYEVISSDKLGSILVALHVHKALGLNPSIKKMINAMYKTINNIGTYGYYSL